MSKISRWDNDEIIYNFGATKKECLEKGIIEKIIFNFADLRGADLQGADLQDADLQDADLLGADLQGAGLQEADLKDADLRGANLQGVDLQCADLRGADLRGAYLRGANLLKANLFNCIGNTIHIKSGQIEKYSFCYTSMILQIGCENHSFDEWKSFSDNDIREMDGNKGLYWWKKWKDWLFELIEKSPAISTKE